MLKNRSVFILKKSEFLFYEQKGSFRSLGMLPEWKEAGEIILTSR